MFRLKAGNHKGLFVFPSQSFIRFASDNHTHMSRADEPVNVHLIFTDPPQSRNYGFQGCHQTNIPDSFLYSLLHHQRIGRSGSFKADRGYHPRYIRVSFRFFNRFKRRVHQLHFRAFSLHVGKASFCSRHLHHIAKSQQYMIFLHRIADALIDIGRRRNAYRASRSGNQRDFRRNQAADSIFENAACMGAADFHQLDGGPVIGLQIIDYILNIHLFMPPVPQTVQ